MRRWCGVISGADVIVFPLIPSSLSHPIMQTVLPFTKSVRLVCNTRGIALLCFGAMWNFNEIKLGCSYKEMSYAAFGISIGIQDIINRMCVGF